MRLALAVLSVLLLVAAPAAHAARPFVTDDARLVDKGGCQVEAFYKRQQKYHEHEFGFLPGCNPWGLVELTLGAVWVDSAQPGDSRTVMMQGKMLLQELQPNGSGFALALGAGRVRPFQAPRILSPYVNGIGSFSFLDDRVVMHANLGALRDGQLGLTRGTWGIGAEVLLAAPRWYGIIEQYGQRLEKPAFQTGLRYWVMPGSVQVDATVGRQHATPFDRRFATVGLRVLW